MTDFYKIIKAEVNTEKSQKAMEAFNIRTFISDKSVRSNDFFDSFVKTFGYEPLEINVLTFKKIIKNKKNRSVRVVEMKKFFVKLPQGKDLNTPKS